VLHSLATLYRSGIDPGSFDVEEIPARIRERFRSGVRNGRSLASSGFVAGLFNELEWTLVTIGETGGRQELVLAGLRVGTKIRPASPTPWHAGHSFRCSV